MSRSRWTEAVRVRLQRPLVRFRGSVKRLMNPPKAPTTNEHLDNIPILLAGCHRSGTSLLRRCIGSHSRIAVPPESLFLEYLGAAVGNPAAERGWAALDLSVETATTELGTWAEGHFQRWLTSQAKPRWADKSPGIMMHLEGVDRLLGHRSQFVFIVRDGMDVAASIGGADPVWWQLGPLLRVEPDPYVAAAYYWAERNQRMRSFMDLHPTRCHRILYKDLVQQPEATLRAAFEFLGEDFEPSVLDFNRFQHSTGLEDHHVSTTTTFEDNRGKHRDLPMATQRKMWAAAGREMMANGFADRTYG